MSEIASFAPPSPAHLARSGPASLHVAAGARSHDRPDAFCARLDEVTGDTSSAAIPGNLHARRPSGEGQRAEAGKRPHENPDLKREPRADSEDPLPEPTDIGTHAAEISVSTPPSGAAADSTGEAETASAAQATVDPAPAATAATQAFDPPGPVVPSLAPPAASPGASDTAVGTADVAGNQQPATPPRPAARVSASTDGAPPPAVGDKTEPNRTDSASSASPQPEAPPAPASETARTASTQPAPLAAPATPPSPPPPLATAPPAQGVDGLPPTPPARAPTLPEQVPVLIAAMAQDGARRFEIRLDPAELGRVDVRLDIDRDGQVRTHLVVERPEALALLRREAHALQLALNDTGLRSDTAGVQVSLRQGGDGQHHAAYRQTPAAPGGRDAGSADDRALAGELSPARARPLRSAIDMML